MDIVTGNLGWIEVICGPMFSGKSEELMRRLRRAIIARKRVQVFKPLLDDRYSVNEIVSHNDLRMKSQSIENAAGILPNLEARTEVIGIDEANFLGAGLVEVVTHLADSGKQVIVAGLDTDYMGRPFTPMPELLSLAESITKTLAICTRCRRCFEPGAPKQVSLEFATPSREFAVPRLVTEPKKRVNET